MTHPDRSASHLAPALPTQSQDFYGFLRTPRYRWWKGLLAVVLLIGGYLLIGGVAAVAGLVVDVALGTVSTEQLLAAANGTIPFGPGLFIGNNLGLALLVPMAMVLGWAFFGQRPGWSASVAGRFRWRWLLWCLLVIGVPWFVLLMVPTLAEGGFPAAVLTPSVWLMLGLTLLTTPLQCAGEEWAFRGLVPRSIAAMVPHPRVGAVVGVAVSSLLFMGAHAAADPWLNAFYVCFGVLTSALTWRTGGLEASVVLHTVNNLTALVPVVLTADYAALGDRSAGTGSPAVLVPLVIGVGLVFLADRVRGWRGVARTAAPGLATLPAPAATYGPSPEGPVLPGSGVPAVPPAGTASVEEVEPIRSSGDSEIRESGDTLGPYEHRDQPPAPGGQQRP